MTTIIKKFMVRRLALSALFAFSGLSAGLTGTLSTACASLTENLKFQFGLETPNKAVTETVKTAETIKIAVPSVAPQVEIPTPIVTNTPTPIATDATMPSFTQAVSAIGVSTWNALTSEQGKKYCNGIVYALGTYCIASVLKTGWKRLWVQSYINNTIKPELKKINTDYSLDTFKKIIDLSNVSPQSDDGKRINQCVNNITTNVQNNNLHPELAYVQTTDKNSYPLHLALDCIREKIKTINNFDQELQRRGLTRLTGTRSELYSCTEALIGIKQLIKNHVKFKQENQDGYTKFKLNAGVQINAPQSWTGYIWSWL